VADILREDRRLEDLLTDRFLRELHRRLYGDIWNWAGRIRKHELNIGIDPWQIPTQLHSSLENIRYRWEHTKDWSPRQLGIVAHAEAVRIPSRMATAVPPDFLPTLYSLQRSLSVRRV